MVIHHMVTTYTCERFNDGMCPYFQEYINDMENPNSSVLCPKVSLSDPHPICIERKIVTEDIGK